DLVNELFALYTKTRRLNYHLGRINTCYEETLAVMNSFAEQHRFDVYRDSVKSQEMYVDAAIKFAGEVLEDSQKVLASVLVLAEEDSLFGKFVRLVSPTSYGPAFEVLRN